MIRKFVFKISIFINLKETYSKIIVSTYLQAKLEVLTQLSMVPSPETIPKK